MNYTYVLRCADNSLYTGWTNDLENRIAQHNLGVGGKYTRARLPVELAYLEVFDNKIDAMKREYEIKQLPKSKKEELVKHANQRSN